MSNINLNVGVGETKTLTFQTKDKYNTEDIVFNIEADQTVSATAGTNINAVGTPSVTAASSNGTTTFTFNYLKGSQGYQGRQGRQGYQGYQGYQGSNASIQMISSSVSMSCDSSNQEYTITNSSTDSQTYFVARLSNSTANITIKSTSENINHTILFVNDTNRAIRFANVVFNTIFGEYPTPHWIPNDKNYFILNAGEAIEIGYLFCTEISAYILSFGNIYTIDW